MLPSLSLGFTSSPVADSHWLLAPLAEEGKTQWTSVVLTSDVYNPSFCVLLIQLEVGKGRKVSYLLRIISQTASLIRSEDLSLVLTFASVYSSPSFLAIFLRHFLLMCFCPVKQPS